jgi:hypothetical protein
VTRWSRLAKLLAKRWSCKKIPGYRTVLNGVNSQTFRPISSQNPTSSCISHNVQLFVSKSQSYAAYRVLIFLAMVSFICFTRLFFPKISAEAESRQRLIVGSRTRDRGEASPALVTKAMSHQGKIYARAARDGVGNVRKSRSLLHLTSKE